MRGLRAPTCSGVQHLGLQRPRAAALRARPSQLSVSAVASKQVIDSEGKKVETKLHEKHAPQETPVPAQMGNGAQRKMTVLDSTDLEGDAVLEKELSDNGELPRCRVRWICRCSLPEIPWSRCLVILSASVLDMLAHQPLLPVLLMPSPHIMREPLDEQHP
jgi:hypothetical protein